LEAFWGGQSWADTALLVVFSGDFRF